MSTIKIERSLYNHFIRVLKKVVNDKELGGEQPNHSLEKTIYEFGKTKKLDEKIFGTDPPEKFYITKRKSDAETKGFALFNLAYLLNTFRYMDIQVFIPDDLELDGVAQAKKAAKLFIQKYLPNKILYETKNALLSIDREHESKSLPEYNFKYKGETDQNGIIDIFEFYYRVNENNKIIGVMHVFYSHGNLSGVYPVELRITGEIIDEKFFLLRYLNKIDPSKQCGVIFMTKDGDRLTGDFSGYFHNIPEERKECKGTIILNFSK